jgi:hypothetical protein
MGVAMRVCSAGVRLASSHRRTVMAIISGMDVHRSREPREQPARKDHQNGKSVQHAKIRATSGLSATLF